MNAFAYIPTVAGATIGFGATWHFPYLVGESCETTFCTVFKQFSSNNFLASFFRLNKLGF